MNLLVGTIRNSLTELELGISGGEPNGWLTDFVWTSAHPKPPKYPKLPISPRPYTLTVLIPFGNTPEVL